MFRFMYNQCEISHIQMPKWSKQWVNIRKAYSNFYQCRRAGIEVMLTNLGMKFEGTPHRGIDDARNIARIALKLIADGCELTVNEYIQIKHVSHSPKKVVRYEAIHDSDLEEDNDRETGKEKAEEPDIIGNSVGTETFEINTFGSGDTEKVFLNNAHSDRRAGKKKHSRSESGNKVSASDHTLSDSMKKLSLGPNNMCEEHDETLQELIKYYKSQKAKS